MPVSWSTLLLDLKLPIIKLLDYESRCNLRQCSANDKLIVDITPFKADTFELQEVDRLKADQAILHIKIDTLQISLTGKNTTYIRRLWNGNEVERFSEVLFENAYDVAKRFINRFSVNGVIKARSISISATNLTPAWQMECDNLSLVEVKADLPWLQRTNFNLKTLKIDVWAGGSQISKLPHIFETAHSFRMFSDSDITDENLKKIKATTLCIKSMDITVEGLKYTVERFLKYGTSDDKIEFEVIVPGGIDARELIPKGVRKEVETFRDEDQDVDDFAIKILDGFVNVHGVQDARILTCSHYGSMVEVICKVADRI